MQPRRGISIGTAQTTQAFNQTTTNFALANIKANSYHQARSRVYTVNSSIAGHSDQNYAGSAAMATQQRFYNPPRQNKVLQLKLGQVGAPAQQRDNFFGPAAHPLDRVTGVSLPPGPHQK